MPPLKKDFFVSMFLRVDPALKARIEKDIADHPYKYGGWGRPRTLNDACTRVLEDAFPATPARAVGQPPVGKVVRGPQLELAARTKRKRKVAA